MPELSHYIHEKYIFPLCDTDDIHYNVIAKISDIACTEVSVPCVFKQNPSTSFLSFQGLKHCLTLISAPNSRFYETSGTETEIKGEKRDWNQRERWKKKKPKRYFILLLELFQKLFIGTWILHIVWAMHILYGQSDVLISKMASISSE